ncbi:MAG: glutathione S-transferase family protein, partial [Halobacteriales archaeon]|nr:glutathione S-transferase family protein [Halobacteriales archaeon]
MARNRLVDGEWRTDAPETTEEGAFAREATTFRDWVRDDPEATHRPETGRYHLYISRSCPWAHGVALTRRLCGLTDVVTMDVVDPLRTGDGWAFTPEKPGCTADSILDAKYLREVYLAT